MHRFKRRCLFYEYDQQTKQKVKIMTNPTKSEIREHIFPVFNAISEGEGLWACETEAQTADAFIAQAISVEYILSGRLNYLGAIIMVNYDGAILIINTNDKTIDTYWNGETYCQHYHYDAMNLNGACREMFEIAVSNRYSKH